MSLFFAIKGLAGIKKSFGETYLSITIFGSYFISKKYKISRIIFFFKISVLPTIKTTAGLLFMGHVYNIMPRDVTRKITNYSIWHHPEFYRILLEVWRFYEN
jgi:hypothetical protein